MTVSLRSILAVALPMAWAAAAVAQTDSSTTTPPPQPAPAPAASTAPSNDQVVQLSEFQVTSTSPNTYVASETMSGSRINTKVIDLPYNVQNLTKEFFDDYNIQILDENMTYIGGLTGINIGGGFNLRGFSATSMLRDGFYRLGRYGLSNIDRIEVIFGPSASIYGRSSPGGMVNFISLSPKKPEEEALSLTTGSFNDYKANLYLTGSLDKSSNTYYVVDINQNARDYVGQYDEVRNKEMFAAVEHDFADGSHLKVSAEYYLQVQHAPQAAAPVEYQTRAATPDNTATTSLVGYDYGLTQYNAYGPNSELNRGSDTFELTYDKQFNDVWSTRFGAYRFMARRWDYNQNTGWGSLTIPVAGSTSAVTDTRGSLPSRGEIMEDGGGFQDDIVAHYFLFNHTVDVRTMAELDLNDYYRWDPTWEYGPSTDPAIVAWNAAGSGRVVNMAPGTVGGRATYIPATPIAYFPNWYNTQELALFSGTGNSITGGPALNGGTLTRRRTTSLGGSVRQLMNFFDNRLFTYLGIRNDSVLFSQRDYTVAFNSVGFGNTLAPGTGGANQPGGSVVRRYEHKNMPSGGLNYLLLPGPEGSDGLHATLNYSSAYFVDQTSRPAVIASSTYAPFTAWGWDYGIKGSYFQDRLDFTVDGYYTVQKNVLVSDTVEYAPGLYTDEPEQDGNQLVRGWEASGSYVVIPETLIIGESFGRVDSRYTNYGSAFPEAIGRSASGITPENGSAYLKYNFQSGPLRGLSFVLNTTYVSSTPTQAPNAGDTTAIVNGASVVTAQTGLWKLRLPSYQIWNAGLLYTLPKMGPWEQQIQFNVNNIFNKFYLKTNQAVGDPVNFMVQYTIRHF